MSFFINKTLTYGSVYVSSINFLGLARHLFKLIVNYKVRHWQNKIEVFFMLMIILFKFLPVTF